MPLYTDEELQELIEDAENEQLPSINIDEIIEFASSMDFNFPNDRVDELTERYRFRCSKKYIGPNLQTYRGCPPSHEKKGKYKAEKLYFYYMKFEESGALKSLVFSKDMAFSDNENDIKNDITKQIDVWLNTINDPNTNPDANTSVTSYPSEIQWNKPCYLTFMLDNEDWKFFYSKRYRTGANGLTKVNDSLHFPENENNGIKYRRNNNHCFRNSFEITTNGNNKKVLCVENHHTKYSNGKPREYITTSNGEVRSDPPDHYKFDLFFRVSTSPKTYIDPQNPSNDTEKKITMIIDPTGTNFGPP